MLTYGVPVIKWAPSEGASVPVADNPYAPPRTSVSTNPGARRRSVLFAVIGGAAVDFFGTFAFGLAASMAVAGITSSGGGTEADIRSLFESGGWQGFSIAMGAFFTGLGGYVGARIANHREFLCAALVGVLAIITGEIMVAMAEDYALWMRIAGDLVAIPAALFGGWVRRLQRQSAPL